MIKKNAYPHSYIGRSFEYFQYFDFVNVYQDIITVYGYYQGRIYNISKYIRPCYYVMPQVF